MSGSVSILVGDCRQVLKTLPDESVHCCVTSPPYFGLRDYGVDGQIGIEPTPDAFVAELVDVFREVRRTLRSDGTLWLNLGDSYAGSWGAQSRGSETPGSLEGSSMLSARQIRAHPKRTLTGSLKNTPGLKPKDLIGIPWRVAFALQADGWYLRSDIIWHKPNPMPESVADRPTSAHEHLFLLAKSERYFYDAAAIREAENVPGWDDGSRVYGGKNKHGANAQHGARTTGRVAGPRRRGVPPRHKSYESSDQSGLDHVDRGHGRNKRNVWTISTRPFPAAHFATFPPALIEPCILAGCPIGGAVLDPFGGAGTTGLVAARLQRDAILIELNAEYADIADNRIRRELGMLGTVEVRAA
jgi:DNA modification methylase